MTFGKNLLLSASALLAGFVLLNGQGPPDAAGDHGIPLFLSAPIKSKIAPEGLRQGHHTFQEGHVPKPFDQTIDPAAYNPAVFASGLLPVLLPSNISNSSEYEGETAAAAFGNLVVAGSNHIFPGACSTNVCFPLAYASTDGFLNTTKTVLERNWNGVNHGIGFDPSVDVNSSGKFFYVYGIAPLSGNYPNGIVMVKSTDGINWTKTTPATYNTKQVFDDKYWVAIDRSRNPNRIYISWDRNTSTNQTLYMIYSDNEGTSWSSLKKVNDGTSKFERVIGAYPAVDQANGTVYTSWHDYAKNKIFVDKSTNGGNSWGTDVLAATTNTGFGMNIGCVGGRSQGPAHQLKVDSAGVLHLVYANNVLNRGFDIMYTRSTNGGATWSAAVTLNDDAGSRHQYHPAMALNGTTVTVSFYDRRNDSANCTSQVYATQSVDSGASWAQNTKVYDTASNFDGNANGPGDYSDATASSVGTFSFFSSHLPGGAYDVVAAAIP